MLQKEILLYKRVSHNNLLCAHKYISIKHTDNIFIITDLYKQEIAKFEPKTSSFNNILFLNDYNQIDDNKCKYQFKQICEGLKYLHKHKLAHCDLKPSNIMIDFDNIVKIIDFGSITSSKVNIIDCGTSTGQFLPPE